jgi:hypothetical protein
MATHLRDLSGGLNWNAATNPPTHPQLEAPITPRCEAADRNTDYVKAVFYNLPTLLVLPEKRSKTRQGHNPSACESKSSTEPTPSGRCCNGSREASQRGEACRN